METLKDKISEAKADAWMLKEETKYFKKDQYWNGRIDSYNHVLKLIKAMDIDNPCII